MWGGDIINPFFMGKIKALLADFPGPCYALSVGIPFSGDATLLSSFDHVFVRSAADFDSAVEAVPPSNVSQTPDLSWLLQQSYWPTLMPSSKPRLGVSLAQPVFYNVDPGVIADLVSLVSLLCETYEVHLLAFNTHDVNNTECDILINDLVSNTLNDLIQKGTLLNVTGISTRDEMMSYISSMDVMLCMRYHAVQYSLQAKKPFAAFYTTSKVNNLLEDTGFSEYGYRLPIDNSCKPTKIDVPKTLALVAKAQETPNILAQPLTVDIQSIYDIVNSRQRGMVKFSAANVEVSSTTMDLSRQYLITLLGVTGNSAAESDISLWFTENVGSAREILKKYNSNIDLDCVARALCFAATKHVSSKYVWGMTQNLNDPAFKVGAALDWVVRHNNVNASVMHVQSIQSDVSIDMTYFLQDDFKEYHRSGWSFCLNGLLRFDTQVTQRPPIIMVDGYTDRTFMWGCSPLTAAGIIPYSNPWMGFVHHTFNDTFGANNCVTMFQNPLFLKSLVSCKCLVVLSYYLAGQLRDALTSVGADHVGVEVLHHPMEQIPSTFTLAQWNNNTTRKIVNIGAWLRDPYSIYALPLYDTWQNPLNIRKAILRGKDMQSTAPPTWLMPFLDKLQYAKDSPVPTIDPVICRAAQASTGECRDGVCRPANVPSIPSNHYLSGMVNMLQRQNSSVAVLEKLSNEAYDSLLSENIVFLSLVDASACNTVMECLMRSTPLLVNRHPAVEEILGATYPGFYENLSHAAQMLGDSNRIAAMHVYLLELPKDQYTLDSFLSGFQDIVRTYTPSLIEAAPLRPPSKGSSQSEADWGPPSAVP